MEMNNVVSINTQVILLLTAPLIVGRSRSPAELLTHGEYNKLARILNENQREPADLLGPDAVDLLKKPENTLDSDRLMKLLERGFLLSQAIERWQARSIWVISRADSIYPKRLKERLKDSAPPLLYGCGDETILKTGGLAVVGSREVDENLLRYTESVGRLAARAGKTVVSGGARGIDKAAMFGSLQIGGRVIGVVTDSLERLALAGDCREYLMDKLLVFVSPYDPAAGFDVGHAMQRNKIIYALADAALVVNSDYEKGGTWAGAIEQLEKLHLVPLYIRSEGDSGKGLKALKAKGAFLWPNPESAEEFEKTFTVQVNQTKANLIPEELLVHQISEPTNLFESQNNQAIKPVVALSEPNKSPIESATPADELFARVREIILKMNMPKTEIELAQDLKVSKSQVKDWLRRLVDEGVLKKKRKPPGYVITSDRQENLFKVAEKDDKDYRH
jgi:DNA processing protein